MGLLPLEILKFFQCGNLTSADGPRAETEKFDNQHHSLFNHSTDTCHKNKQTINFLQLLASALQYFASLINPSTFDVRSHLLKEIKNYNGHRPIT